MTNLGFQDPRATEQRNPRTERIDVASSLEIVDLMNGEDATVAGVVRGERERIAAAIDLIVEAFRARGADGIHAPQGRHRDQAGPQHADDGGDDPAGEGLRQPHGGPGRLERQAARPRRADRDGVLWGESRGSARGDHGGGRERQARDRDGASQGQRRRGAPAARGGRRLRPSRRRRSARRDAMSDTLAVGVMSGTSLDGISTALVRLRDGAGGAELVAFRQEPYSSAERGAIIDAMARGTPKDVAFLHVALGVRLAAGGLRLRVQGWG